MTKQIVDNFSNTAPDVKQIAFSAVSDTILQAFTASNISSVNASYRAFIVSSSGGEQPQIPFRIVVWGENDLGIGVVGQIIPAGGFLMVESSAIESIYFTATGNVLQ